MAAHEDSIRAALPHVLARTDLRIGKKYTGKVRDVYELREHMILVTTDRLSAFDRLLACVPYKGMVLNLVSQWWFRATEHIVPNHVLSVPHPAVTIGRKCAAFKVEVVVRAYLTGSTSTSIWMHYARGVRSYCGHTLPDGMAKNARLPYVMVTPTTKSDEHDVPVSGEEVVSMGLMSAADWAYVHDKALEIFAFGASEAACRGLILVDTKYEFGKDAGGVIRIIDEMHTPDSSRYWMAGTYEERVGAGKEPENVDKEFLRIWFRDNCDPYADAVLPDAPTDLVVELSRRYIRLFELITGQAFPFPTGAAAAQSSQAAVEAAVYAQVPPSPAVVLAVFGTGDAAAAAAANSAGDAIVFAKGVASRRSEGGISYPLTSFTSISVDFALAPQELVSAAARTARSDGVIVIVFPPTAGRADHVSRLFAVQTKSVVIVVGETATPLEYASVPVARVSDAAAAVAFVKRVCAAL